MLLKRIKNNPAETLAGVCVFTVVAAGASVANVASAALFVLFVMSLFHASRWLEVWRCLSSLEKLILSAFFIYTLSAILPLPYVEDIDEYVKQFGRYLRFTLIIPVYLMFKIHKMDLRAYLVSGVVFSGYLFFLIAVMSTINDPLKPASGAYHHITFGDAAILSAGIMGVLLLTTKYSWLLRLIIVISLFGALYASLMSQARGAWLVIPFYIVGTLVFIIVNKKIRCSKLLGAILAVLTLIFLTPSNDVIVDRYNQAIVEIDQFYHGERFDTSVGGRLAMWDIGVDVWKKNPVFGSGPGDFDDDMQRYQSTGKYSLVELHSSTHNIYIQALVGTGMVGFLALVMALIVLPLKLFYAGFINKDKFSAIGIVVLVSYAVFGLSESWTLRAPVISMYMIYVISVMTIVSNRIKSSLIAGES